MRRRLSTVVLLGLTLVAAGAVSACGAEEEDHYEVVEGEPLELGELRYNVQITRFLNPADAEDDGYLREQPPPPSGENYLGVFMRIDNEGTEPLEIPAEMTIRDTRDNVYEPIETDNPFALELGSVIEPAARVPAPDTVAASGVIRGSMVLFLLDEAVTENRPLELEIPNPGGEPGLVELDI
jgi:hypothetical protein